MKSKTLYFTAFLIYVVVDVGYNVAIGLKLDNAFYEKAGILPILNTQIVLPWTLLVFFILIALANFVLVIVPAIQQKSIQQAFIHGFLLGITAYATFALPFIWLIKNYPALLSLIHILLGGIFSALTSGITTLLYFRYSWGKKSS